MEWYRNEKTSTRLPSTFGGQQLSLSNSSKCIFASQGDVGGPGVVGPRLMGVVSFGAPVCGSSDAPTVFTKIGYYADWIDKVLVIIYHLTIYIFFYVKV